MAFLKCSGPFSVGCCDIMTKAKGIPKCMDVEAICSSDLGLLIRLYYPCEHTPSLKLAKWLPEPHGEIYARGMAAFNSSSWIVGWLMYKMTKNLTIEAFLDAPVLDQECWKSNQPLTSIKENDKMPIILFSHGMGGNRALYSLLCNQLASEGFVVAAIEHRDRSSVVTVIYDEDGNPVVIPLYLDADPPPWEVTEELRKLRNAQMEKRCKEVTAVLDLVKMLDESPEEVHNCSGTKFDLKTLKGRLDTTLPVLLGQSYGGLTAVQGLREDGRFKCGIALDPWFLPLPEEFYDSATSETDRPILVIQTEYGYSGRDDEVHGAMKRCYKLMKNTTPDFIELVTLRKTIHEAQMDVPCYFPNIYKMLMWLTHGGKEAIPFDKAIDEQRKLISDYLGRFFEKKGEGPVKLLDDSYKLADVFIEGSFIEDDE